MCEIDIENPLKLIPEFDYTTWKIEESVVEHNKFSFKDFFNNFMIRNLPCLIKNIAIDWECSKKWVKNNQVNFNYIIEEYGNLMAPVADCENIQYNSQCKTDMRVSDFIKYLNEGDDSKTLYLKDWHLKRSRPDDNFYNIPPYFALDWLNEYAIDNKDDDFMFVYIGPKRSWTPLHEDVYSSYSWSVNIVGRKKWILFPPGEENKLKDIFGNVPLTFNAENYNHIKYFEVIQDRGDAIFVPSGWYHEVVNELNTISINHNWINACNIDMVWKALQKSLLMVEHQIEEFKDTPEFPSQCQLMLKSFFGMDFEIFIRLLCYIAEKRLNQLNGESRLSLGNYYLSKNTIKFDLKNILTIMDSISSHPVFLQKCLSIAYDDIVEIKNNIKQILDMQ